MKTKLKGIGILGSGAWGTALASILNKKTNISLWSYEKETTKQINKYKINKNYLPGIKIPNNVTITNDLEELKTCKFIFICIPSQFIKKIIVKFKKFYKREMILVICSKGIEKTSKELISEVIKKKYQNLKLLFYQDQALQSKLLKKNQLLLQLLQKIIKMQKN